MLTWMEIVETLSSRDDVCDEEDICDHYHHRSKRKMQRSLGSGNVVCKSMSVAECVAGGAELLMQR